MTDQRVIAVYSRALFGLARDRGLVDAVAAELKAFGQAVESSPELYRLWRRVRLPVEVKAAVWRALQPHLSPLTGNFLAVLIRHHREPYLFAVLERFSDLARRDRGRAGVRVSSAVPLSAALRAELHALAERIAGAEADVEYTVDPELLGGFVLRVGDRVADASLRGRLERLQAAFAGGSEVSGYQSPG